MTILNSSKLKEFADYDFKFDENDMIMYQSMCIFLCLYRFLFSYAVFYIEFKPAVTCRRS